MIIVDTLRVIHEHQNVTLKKMFVNIHTWACSAIRSVYTQFIVTLCRRERYIAYREFFTSTLRRGRILVMNLSVYNYTPIDYV